MAANSSVTLYGHKKEDLPDHRNQQLQHSPGKGATAVVVSLPARAASQSRKRRHPGNPSPDAEAVALSPNTLMATNRFVCKSGATFSRRDKFRYHRSFFDALDGEVARHTKKRSVPHSSMAPSILPNVSNPGSISLGSAAGWFIAPSNMYNFGFGGGLDLNFPQNDLDLNINNLFSDLMMNVEPWDTALHQNDGAVGANSNSVALMKSMGSSFSCGMKLSNYGEALGDGMSFGGRVGRGSTFQEMYNNLNVGGETYGGFGGGMEYSRDQMNAQNGGMMYNVKNADGILVGEVNNNVVVEPQMNVQSEFSDKLTRDFLGMGNGMNSLTGGGMENYHNGNGMGTKSPDNQATTSAQARPFVPCCCQGF